MCQAVMPFSSIREVTGSNLDRDTYYTDWGISWLFLVPPDKIPG
jgi:hypothetical protein